MKYFYRLIFLSLTALSLSCTAQTGQEKMEMKYSIVTVKKELALSASKGKEGIPEIIAVLEHHMETHYATISWGAINSSISHLHELAKQGIYTEEVLPVLVRAIKKQISLSDTLETAEAITLLSGIDVGYTPEFVKNYKVEDEPEWLAKIAIWEAYLLEKH